MVYSSKDNDGFLTEKSIAAMRSELAHDIFRQDFAHIFEAQNHARVEAFYQAWGEWNNEVLLTYQKETPPLPPLSGQPQFKSIKNMVIAEAMQLGGHHFTFEDEQMTELPEPLITEPVPEMEVPQDIPEDLSFHATWSKTYKQAKQYLFGGAVEQDFEKAFQLFLQEAESGNALAMYDLGRMCADGLGREINLDAAQEWYSKALAAFQVVP